MLVLSALCIALPFALGAKLIQLLLPGPEWRDLGNVLRGVLIVVVYVGVLRQLEKRSISELSLPGAPLELGAGAGLGLLLVALYVAGVALLGRYEVAGTQVGVAFSSVLPAMLVVAVAEELLLRGLLFRRLEQAWGSAAALALSSLLFGLMHLANPNATLWTSISLGAGIGLLFGAAFMLTRRLWLPIGLHFGWNFAQAGLLGVPMSGFEPKAWLQTRLSGPEWLTGGGFGAEGAVHGLLLCLVASAWMLRAARQRGHWIAKT